MMLMAALLVAAPGMAQVAGPGAPRAVSTETPGAVPKRAPINGVLTLYGNERCPTDTDGNEVDLKAIYTEINGEEVVQEESESSEEAKPEA